MVPLMGVRTRFLDDHIAAAASPQRVTVGSGLDARSARLPDDGAAIYEVDFESMLTAKRDLFSAAGYQLNASLVGTDLSQKTWRRDLAAAGFDREVKTTWLVEGVTGYLQPNELDALLEAISDLSTPGSVLLATWRRPVSRGRSMRHRGDAAEGSWAEGRFISLTTTSPATRRRGGDATPAQAAA